MRRITLAATLAAALCLPAVAQAQPDSADRSAAQQECRTERSAMGTDNFRQKYGTNRNKRNAFGKCVSRRSRDEEREEVQARQNASQQCRAERDTPEADFRAAHGGQSFAEFYGTNANDSNAFGKCVSQKARANEEQSDEEDEEMFTAQRACRGEQLADRAAFRERYGTNHNKRNAFGKCVSQKAQEQEEQEQQEQQPPTS